MHYDKEKIAKRLKDERKSHSLTQAALALQLKVGRDTIRDWETSKRIPPLEDMLAMCSIFECELGYLLCEYDTKLRDTADVQEITGLREDAIQEVIRYGGASDRISDILASSEFYLLIVRMKGLAERKARYKNAPDFIRSNDKHGIAEYLRLFFKEVSAKNDDLYQLEDFISTPDAIIASYESVVMKNAKDLIDEMVSLWEKKEGIDNAKPQK